MSTTGEPALEADGLGRRYRRGWALRYCTFEVPAGRVAGLVGPNGAGKSTLMALATGLLRPTTGTIRVQGRMPGRSGTDHTVAFLGQDKPLYRRFTVADMLRAGQALNPVWDRVYAERLVREAEVPTQARIGTLSGGQRTRVALAVALGRRPSLLLLDEPLSDLDPLAREAVMRTLMSEVAETGTTVLLSSHVLADLEDICDHLLLLVAGRVHLAGDVDDLLAGHRLLVGPHREGEQGRPPGTVVETRTTGRQRTVLVRTDDWDTTVDWDVHQPSLEELAMAYLRSAASAQPTDERKVAAA